MDTFQRDDCGEPIWLKCPVCGDRLDFPNHPKPGVCKKHPDAGVQRDIEGTVYDDKGESDEE